MWRNYDLKVDLGQMFGSIMTTLRRSTDLLKYPPDLLGTKLDSLLGAIVGEPLLSDDQDSAQTYQSNQSFGFNLTLVPDQSNFYSLGGPLGVSEPLLTGDQESAQTNQSNNHLASF
ncbi:hypothetical protein RND71_007655 [Anisodus tanguticus]|uniref:Uncharacterized protein n=1 Tax=Anisodus tanguticus TaxID=243964 RepID=A0AAE1SMC3_9SOLA|nr:hypothetical protein RND71_007655 [Anisodus tanguticus]